MTNQTQTTNQLPTTWAAICALKSDLFAEAKQDAANNWDLRVIRSRGAVLVAEDAEGKTLLATGESWDMPKTLKDFKAALETIKGRFPTAARVLICIGCDGAESVRAMNDGDYTPWAGEATGLVYEYPQQEQEQQAASASKAANGELVKLLDDLSSSRNALNERLAQWERLTRSALVGEQWIICTPDALAAYKLVTVKALGNGMSEFSSEFCSLQNAPLYSQKRGKEVLARQQELRADQELVLMHIREAITKRLASIDSVEAAVRAGMAA
ncbi:hypothetical protein [Aeromonas sp. Y311-2]|uniref:hypothetical protein n=1 Tax=Aeromonas sp. Y311-2 TaxID=2990507 RepID=UPI0022E31A0D|nr:hypothetical protein [Aeromonas sp. Y311-2]